jgi:hypothetical protein
MEAWNGRVFDYGDYKTTFLRIADKITSVDAKIHEIAITKQLKGRWQKLKAYLQLRATVSKKNFSVPDDFLQSTVSFMQAPCIPNKESNKHEKARIREERQLITLNAFLNQREGRQAHVDDKSFYCHVCKDDVKIFVSEADDFVCQVCPPTFMCAFSYRRALNHGRGIVAVLLLYIPQR